MGLHRTPEDHAANPPESWQVVKVAPRAFELRQADGSTLHQFTTRREAEEHKASGFYVDLYRKEGRWFAGEQIAGWKPYRPPLHRLTQTHTTPAGEPRTTATDSADMTAAEAQRRKVQRLRDAGRTFTEGPGWVEYPHPDMPGWSVRLEWTDTTLAVSTAPVLTQTDTAPKAPQLREWPDQLDLLDWRCEFCGGGDIHTASCVANTGTYREEARR